MWSGVYSQDLPETFGEHLGNICNKKDTFFARHMLSQQKNCILVDSFTKIDLIRCLIRLGDWYRAILWRETKWIFQLGLCSQMAYISRSTLGALFNLYIPLSRVVGITCSAWHTSCYITNLFFLFDHLEFPEVYTDLHGQIPMRGYVKHVVHARILQI